MIKPLILFESSCACRFRARGPIPIRKLNRLWPVAMSQNTGPVRLLASEVELKRIWVIGVVKSKNEFEKAMALSSSGSQ